MRILMNDPPNNSSDVAFWLFLDELKNSLRAVREDQNALRLSLRRTCEHFKLDDGCIAVATPGTLRAEVMTVIPRGGKWDLDCLAAFLQKQRPRIPSNIIMAPIQRRGRLWGVLALREAQSAGVTPVIETNCHWHTCRLMVFSVQIASSPSELPTVGEAEAGTAGEQPAKE